MAKKWFELKRHTYELWAKNGPKIALKRTEIGQKTDSKEMKQYKQKCASLLAFQLQPYRFASIVIICGSQGADTLLQKS